MSIDAAFNNVSIALKNFWEACFMDEEGRPLSWTMPLITSINTPRLKLIVTSTDGGAMKAYTGYELPDNISIIMYETPDKKVEKYLDGWMFGPKGVFNKETGKFRSRGKGEVSNIYRKIKFSTFIYENDTAGQPTSRRGIKKYNHREKIMSTQFYTCAIEGYEVATYDYETGGPLSYTVNLSVLNYDSEPKTY